MRLPLLLLGTGLWAATLPASAEVPPLSRDALMRCALQVQTLRVDAPRLTQTSYDYEQRRQAINQRSVVLKAERDRVPADDLEQGLAIRQQLQQHRDETIAFNAQVEQLKRDIQAINLLKQDYDRGCAQRPYRRSDLESLPGEQQAAMKAGLSGIRVPYLDASAASSSTP